MANKTIGDLTAGTTPDGTELFHGVQGGNSRKFTALQLLTPSISLANQAAARVSVGAALKGHLFGLVLSNNVTDVTNDIDIASGEAASGDSNPGLMVLSAGITKRLDAAWAVGSGNGGLDTGAVGNNTYFVWLIKRSDTAVVDVLFSLSDTAPTMPTNYDLKALIGKFARTGAANTAPRSYSQKEATEWVQYTPTFSNFGTVSGVSVWSRRVGDTLHIRGRFTSGTPVAAEGRMTFGYNGINGNVTSSTAKISAIQLAGPMIISLASAISAYVLAEPNVGSLAFSYQDGGSNGFTKRDGASFGTGTTMSFTAEILVEGW